MAQVPVVSLTWSLVTHFESMIRSWPHPSTASPPSGGTGESPRTKADIREALQEFERGPAPPSTSQPTDRDGYASPWRDAQLSSGPPAGPRRREEHRHSKVLPEQLAGRWTTHSLGEMPLI